MNDLSERPVTVRQPDATNFGAFLQRARLSRGFSLQQIADDTKVSSRYLAALERGHVEILPEGVYRRAIVRAYAAFIGLNQADAIERYAAAFEQPPQEPPPPPAPSSGSANVVIRAVITAAAISLCAGVAVLASFLGPESSAASPSPTRVLVANEVRQVPTSEATTGILREDGVDSEAAVGTLAPPPVVNPSLTITSEPAGARVTVNGVGWGVTPVTIRHLPPGSKVVRLTLDGYAGQQRTVTVGESARSSVRVRLRSVE